MAARGVKFESGSERVTYRTLEVICTKSIWLVHLDIPYCQGIKGDLAPVGLLLGLRVFKAGLCLDLTGAWASWVGGESAGRLSLSA